MERCDRDTKGRWWETLSQARPFKWNPRLVVVCGVLLFLIIVVSVGQRSDLPFLAGGGSQNSGRGAKYHAQLPGRLAGEGEFFACDRSQTRTDICNMRGDIRVHRHQSSNWSIVLYSKDAATAPRVEIVKPYTRKWEQRCMDTIHPVTLRSVPPVDAAGVVQKPPACDVIHKVPGVVFSTGGYTGNLFHDFNDGLIPVFITSQHLQREVVFIVSEFHIWWLRKYVDVLQQLSKSEVLDLTDDTRVHCFPEIEAGLHIHDELTVDPSRMPHRETILDFRAFLDHGYGSVGGRKQLPSAPPTDFPRLTIVVRKRTRRFLNLDEIVKTAEELGFTVSLLALDGTTTLNHIFGLLSSSDVLLGVHGAALTHFLFMRPGTVLIQVVPLGVDWAAQAYFGKPSVKFGLHYLPLNITPSESSLSEKYNLSDPILRKPNEVLQRRGWWVMKEIFLDDQDVRPSPTRVRRTLKRALETLRVRPKVPHPHSIPT